MQPFDFILNKEPIFLLAAVRIFAILMTSPLMSMRNVSRIAKVALAGLTAFMVTPYAYPNFGNLNAFSLEYLLLLLGEGLIGVLTGFFISILFSTFSTAGQFFSFQMGFGASGVFDALAQVENPLVGQYFNFIAVLIFLRINGFQRLFLGGIMICGLGINIVLKKNIKVANMLPSIFIPIIVEIFINLFSHLF